MVTVTCSKATIWVFDFDGTLSEIVEDREAAALHPDCHDLIEDLGEDATSVVAVMSSRSLGDLLPRVPVPNVALGGSSGLEWQMPDGAILPPPNTVKERLEVARDGLIPALEPLRRIPGVEIEDKKWSLAIHFRQAPMFRRPEIFGLLETVGTTPGIAIHHGPQVAEVQLVRGADKSMGLRRLIRATRGTSAGAKIVYAGDDQNDATAIRWTLSQGGAGIVVGDSIRVPGALHVPNPPSLASVLRAVWLEKAGCR
jgi:trehalose 6-phosphate phosphatase